MVAFQITMLVGCIAYVGKSESKIVIGIARRRTATRKEVSDEDDIIARLETRILARTGSMVSGARTCTCSEWMALYAEASTNTKKSYARPALALFWQFALQPTGGSRGI